MSEPQPNPIYGNEQRAPGDPTGNDILRHSVQGHIIYCVLLLKGAPSASTALTSTNDGGSKPRADQPPSISAKGNYTHYENRATNRGNASLQFELIPNAHNYSILTGPASTGCTPGPSRRTALTAQEQLHTAVRSIEPVAETDSLIELKKFIEEFGLPTAQCTEDTSTEASVQRQLSEEQEQQDLSLIHI